MFELVLLQLALFFSHTHATFPLIPRATLITSDAVAKDLESMAPEPTAAPMLKIGHMPHNALFARALTETCGYYEGDINSPYYCNAGSACGFFISNRWGCCATEGLSSFSPGCSVFTTCVDDATTDGISDNTLFCSGEYPHCGYVELNTFTQTGCWNNPGVDDTLLATPTAGTTTQTERSISTQTERSVSTQTERSVSTQTVTASTSTSASVPAGGGPSSKGPNTVTVTDSASASTSASPNSAVKPNYDGVSWMMRGLMVLALGFALA